ncbi:MAG: hypothetical protein ACI9PP_000343 [Halobacteriales archaeon]|jgi:hypothetical protein
MGKYIPVRIFEWYHTMVPNISLKLPKESFNVNRNGLEYLEINRKVVRNCYIAP